MSSSHSMTPTSSFCWGLKLHYEETGFFTRWFESEKDRNKHERSLNSYTIKPIFIEKINPPSPDSQELQDDCVVVRKSDLQTAYVMAAWNAHDQRCAHFIRDLIAAGEVK